MLNNIILTTMRPYLLLLLMILSLAGCKTPQPPTMAILDTPAARQAFWEQQEKTLANLTRWETTGKIGIKHNHKGQSARWNWQHQDPHFDTITLSGPLNQGTVMLTRAPQEVTLSNAKGETYHGHDPHTLLLKTTGWSLPINSLYYWIRGLPDPAFPKHITLNSYGTLATLNQSDWQVHYLAYQSVNGYWLPQKINIRHRETYITLVLNTWELP